MKEVTKKYINIITEYTLKLVCYISKIAWVNVWGNNILWKYL